MRSRRLYFAIRSDRLTEPVLICPVLSATARSAMVVSSVSPERWLMTAVQPARCAISTASIVSVRVPIWFSLTRMQFAARSRMARARRSVLVTSRSSPTSWTRSPRRGGQRRPALPVVLGQAVLELTIG